MDNHIIMSRKESSRYDIVRKAIDKEIKGPQAAEILNLTARHIRRLKRRVVEQGMDGLVHAGRGKPGNCNIPDKEKEKIKKLLHKHYHDFGPTFAAEKLSEDHEISRDPKTVRAIMIGEGLWKPKTKKKQTHRSWRQRRSSYGELQQYDGSYEYWFEDRGSKCCLLAAIDDATGRITQARFDEHEGVWPTFAFWRAYLEKHGKPLAVYVDKFSTYSMNHKLAKENPDTLTQFQRAMESLGVEVIRANSSQAKGRVERLFKTLQDRLIKELRLNGISTVEKANEFLATIFIPKFDARFGVIPRSKTDLHAKVSKKEKNSFPSVFSKHYERIVRNDYTLSYDNVWYQLKETQSITVFPKDVVSVEERSDGTVAFRLRGKYLNYRKLPARPEKVSAKKIPWTLSRRVPVRPAADHPWKTHTYAKP